MANNTDPQPGDTITIYADKLEPHHLIVGIADGQGLIGITFPVEQVIESLYRKPEEFRSPGEPYIYLVMHPGISNAESYTVALRPEVKVNITI